MPSATMPVTTTMPSTTTVAPVGMGGLRSKQPYRNGGRHQQGLYAPHGPNSFNRQGRDWRSAVAGLRQEQDGLMIFAELPDRISDTPATPQPILLSA
jgi:hypothetical protein